MIVFTFYTFLLIYYHNPSYFIYTYCIYCFSSLQKCNLHKVMNFAYYVKFYILKPRPFLLHGGYPKYICTKNEYVNEISSLISFSFLFYIMDTKGLTKQLLFFDFLGGQKSIFFFFIFTYLANIEY